MNILGINHSNEAAAALYSDGRIRSAYTEERRSRVKHDASFPHRAITSVLGCEDKVLSDCEAVAFFWNPILHMDAANRRLTASPRSHLEYLYSLPNNLWPGDQLSQQPFVELSLPVGDSPKRAFFINHHLCHAAHAFFESPFDEAAILTVDGYGERTTTFIGKGRGNHIEPVMEVRFPHSIGSVYAAVTTFLGFRANAGEGKVMGLASYGDPKYVGLFRELLKPSADGFEVDLSYFSYFMDGAARFNDKLVKALGEPRLPNAPIEKRHEDVAASLQLAAEEALIHLAKLAKEKTGLDHLCMAGGVALNCVANGRIVDESGFDSLFFQPACHDSGTSAGAALYAAQMIFGEEREKPDPKTDYLGPQFDADHLREVLIRAGVTFREPSDLYAEAASRLNQGRIIGRFNGRAEFGPRALGNRSILAAPGPEAVKDTVNARVKFREPFRPFAPSVLEEKCGDYFDRSIPSPFMLRVYSTKKELREHLGAITHVDGTARVQTVNPRQNDDYYQLISAYGAQSGTSCVLNTSFNVRGEPIVDTPEDALKCFFTTDMDDLFLGPFAVDKG